MASVDRDVTWTGAPTEIGTGRQEQRSLLNGERRPPYGGEEVSGVDQQGRGVNDVKKVNRRLVLRAIADTPRISRGELARKTGLSKMSMSNIISELMGLGIVREIEAGRCAQGALGRRPGYLDLTDTSPCVIGVFISRHGVQVTAGDLRTRILCWDRRAYPPAMDQDALIALTLQSIRQVRRGLNRPVLGIGIAAIGPVSTQRGTILSPANFFGLRDIPIVEAVERDTGLPVFLASDSMAGAQGEKLFGQGRAHSNFLFLLIWEGIGCGIIVEDKPYAGARGLGGELGHTCIRFDGPPCSCGGRGCLELYANTRRMALRVERSLPQQPLPPGCALDWPGIWRAALAGHPAALAACQEYCDYLACALVNMVNVFDPELIYLCQQEDESYGGLIRDMLEERIQRSSLAPDCRAVPVRFATFGPQAAVVGSLAMVVGQVFNGALPFQPDGD